MSNLRAGIPSSRGRRKRSVSPVFLFLIVLFLLVAAGGFAAGFLFGRSSASKQQEPPAAVVESDQSADRSNKPEESSEAEENTPAEASSTVEPVEPAATTGTDRQPAKPTGIKVCIDAGHGGNDGGTSDKDRLEKNDNLELSKVVKEEMEFRGIEVVMTREEDVYVSLDKRCEIANDSGADYLISLHRNAAGGIANGVEVWRSHRADDEAISFANHVHDHLIEAGISHDRGVRIGSQSSENFDLQMNRNTNMPSVLIELGFIEMEEDNKLYDANKEAYAQALAQAVLDTYEEFHQ